MLNNQAPLTTEISSPVIAINLHYFLSLACKGIEQTAIISREFGVYLQLTDPKQEHIFIEEIENNLCKLYPIAEWKSCLRRRQQEQERSENLRQIKFKLEEEQSLVKQKVQRRRDILAETLADVKKAFPHAMEVLGKKRGLTTYGQQEEFLIYLIFQGLRGENPAAADKFGIGKELIEEFKLLPKDPDFKNRYFLGGVEEL